MNRLEINYSPYYFGDMRIDDGVKSQIVEARNMLDTLVPIIFYLNVGYIQASQRHNLPSMDVRDDLEAFIGDGIGDDFIQNYLSKKEQKEVIQLFLRHLQTRPKKVDEIDD